jgi:phosphate transport system substrate-binding protein
VAETDERTPVGPRNNLIDLGQTQEEIMPMSQAGLTYTLLLAFLLLPPVSLRAQTPAQRLIVGGALSLAPLAEKFSAEFRKNHPQAEVEIRRGNSNYAVGAAHNGEIQVGLVTRNLTGAEAADFRVESMGRDAIIMLSYSWNTATDLTLDQLRKIYLGKIVNWREVGGEDKGIVPLTREASAAIHGTFVEKLFGKGFDGREKAFVLRASKEKILRTIKRVRGSLGYGIVRVEEAEAEGVRVLAIDGKAPTAENIRQGIYPFTRPLLLIAKKNPGPLAEQWMREFGKFVSESEGGR